MLGLGRLCLLLQTGYLTLARLDVGYKLVEAITFGVDLVLQPRDLLLDLFAVTLYFLQLVLSYGMVSLAFCSSNRCRCSSVAASMSCSAFSMSPSSRFSTSASFSFG